ncbi:MAG: low specificity L-threonine aldolase [Clostridia bacterium]|nr:low specificity L-threonine aldolase [Clostridia bacterium]MBQ9945204.1 low specificity L-threonine aldolase [Clostridia bacterium]
MIKFDCDYLEGAHPRILDALVRTNFEQTPGYAVDDYCKEARELIKKECKAENADVHFIVGGTGTNATVIAASLKPYQGVVCAVSGHINVHESGAIEATGHKVIGLPSDDGKLEADILEEYCRKYWADSTYEHMVQPGMLYISQPTENGTLYKAEELKRLREICDNYSMLLYVDGARMGYGLMSEGNDVTLPLLSELADVFYIGGTKVGALFGEALVIVNDSLKKDFRYMQKRHCGMFAKGRLLGLQFREMFIDGLYYEMGAHGIKSAYRVRDAFRKAGFPFLYESSTNQQFPVLPDTVLDILSEKFSWDYWCRVDEEHSCVRFCTSWATKEENIVALEEALSEFSAKEE